MNNDLVFLFLDITVGLIGFGMLYKASKGYGMQKPWLLLSGPFSSPKKTTPLWNSFLIAEGLVFIFIAIYYAFKG